MSEFIDKYKFWIALIAGINIIKEALSSEPYGAASFIGYIIGSVLMSMVILYPVYWLRKRYAKK